MGLRGERCPFDQKETVLARAAKRCVGDGGERGSGIGSFCAKPLKHSYRLRARRSEFWSNTLPTFEVGTIDGPDFIWMSREASFSTTDLKEAKALLNELS